MPVDPNHIYADVAHPCTVKDSCWRYGCHSEKLGPAPRGRETVYQYLEPGQPRYNGYDFTCQLHEVDIKTEWLPKKCGHTLRGTDPNCSGCSNRSDDD